MADFLKESFEGSGYENSWSETEGAGNTVDEDDVGPGSLPTGGGSQCIETRLAGANADAYTTFNYGSGQNTDNYIRFYYYIHPDTDTTDTTQLIIFTLKGAVANIRIDYRYTATDGHQLIFYIYDNGALKKYTNTNMSTGQWYRIEGLYDSVGEAYEFLIDGVSIVDGAIGTPRTDSQYIVLGPQGDRGTDELRLFFDLIAWGNDTWYGEEGAAAAVGPARKKIGLGLFESPLIGGQLCT